MACRAGRRRGRKHGFRAARRDGRECLAGAARRLFLEGSGVGFAASLSARVAVELDPAERMFGIAFGVRPPLRGRPRPFPLAFSRRGILLRRQARWRRVWLSHDGGSGPGATVFVIISAHPDRSRPLGRVPPA